MKVPIDINHIAYLARINLDNAELDRFQEEIGKIVNYVESISEIDLTDVQPTAHVNSVRNVLRADEAGETMPQSDLLNNAPQVLEDDYVQVPKVIVDQL